MLHKLGGRPLIAHVCRTAGALDPRRICVVVGHQAERVEAAVREELNQEKIRVEFAFQREQLGTGHAVNSAREVLTRSFDEDSTLLVLSGDVPMIRAETLAALVQQHRTHRGRGAAVTILTVKLADPTGYGRIVRNDLGFERIVEQKDATDDERRIREINSGIYCFDTKLLFEALSRVSNNNKQGEYYLTDVPQILREEGHAVSLFLHNDAREVAGVNNREDLADLEKVLRNRVNSRLMRDYGVTLLNPKQTYISEDAQIGRDTVIHPNVSIEGKTKIGDGCEIYAGSRISNAVIGRNVAVLDNSLIVDSIVRENCTIGPMAHVRGGALIEPDAKIGNFVEVKKSIVGRNSKASHLTYLGDAEIGENTNIGAGTITCNFDGTNKHRTKIGSRVKIGSDTMLVAPITIGDGAVTAAGSVVTKDVEPETLVAGVPAKVKKSLNIADKSESAEA